MNTGYPDDIIDKGPVTFGDIVVPDEQAVSYIRYLYPWTSENTYKLTATWGSKTHEVVFKIGDEELKKLEAGQQLNVNVSLLVNKQVTIDWKVDDWNPVTSDVPSFN